MTDDGRVVLLTGASGGIGRAIARRFAARGDRLALHFHRGTDRVDGLLRSLPGTGHRTFAADLEDAGAIERLVGDVLAAYSRVDVLVNNAGIFLRHPPLEVDYVTWQERFRETLAVNLVAPANLCWQVARSMVAAGGGTIINVSSRGAFRGEPECPAYGASKAGLNSLSQSLALALGPHGVHVFAVAPGFVETAMARDYMTGELAESIRRQSPLGRVARAGDVAYWVVAMADPEAEFATGAIVDVNGASYLRS